MSLHHWGDFAIACAALLMGLFGCYLYKRGKSDRTWLIILLLSSLVVSIFLCFDYRPMGNTKKYFKQANTEFMKMVESLSIDNKEWKDYLKDYQEKQTLIGNRYHMCYYGLCVFALTNILFFLVVIAVMFSRK